MEFIVFIFLGLLLRSTAWILKCTQEAPRSALHAQPVGRARRRHEA
jgi:hypothetical protein